MIFPLSENYAENLPLTETKNITKVNVFPFFAALNNRSNKLGNTDEFQQVRTQLILIVFPLRKKTFSA